MPNKVRYERVNLADIDTSSDDDDYGDLFAAERARGKGGKMGGKKKGKRCSGRCLRGSCLLLTVAATLVILAGVAIYLDILKPLNISYYNHTNHHNHTADVSDNTTLSLISNTTSTYSYQNTSNIYNNQNTSNIYNNQTNTNKTQDLAQEVTAGVSETTTHQDIEASQARDPNKETLKASSEESDEDGSRPSWLSSSFDQNYNKQTSFGDNYRSVASYSSTGSA